MIQGTGLPVFPGVAIGPAFVHETAKLELPTAWGSAAEERQRFTDAKAQAQAQLQTLLEETAARLGQEHAMILDVQIMMLDDLDYVEAIEARIDGGDSAAHAVQETGEEFAEVFASMDDEYMKARSTDVRDVSRRVVEILCGFSSAMTMDVPGVLLAEDLTPSETVQLPKDKILAFVTRKGSANSHTAILARTMGIPSLVAADVDLSAIHSGDTVIVDGFTGQCYIRPDEATLAEMTAKQAEAQTAKEALEAYRGKETRTAKGRKVKLYTNIGSPDDVELVLKNDGEGVGLLRSEFLYLGRDTYPTEEELYTAYRQVVEGLQGRPVIVRTLDIGADKQADYFQLDAEENPALGLRGVRLCLSRPELFRTQLRAIYRASAHGPVSMMFPMIASLWEVQEVKALCKTIREELTAEGVAIGDVPLGIMIETPAAAVISDTLAHEVDFFSVGTNDLTQYTLAADRQNSALGRYCDPRHPALLWLLQRIADSAHAAGIWCGICGELAADAAMTNTLMTMGYDELSVSPAQVLKIRKAISESEVVSQ